jgi:hypothetical protein
VQAAQRLQADLNQKNETGIAELQRQAGDAQAKNEASVRAAQEQAAAVVDAIERLKMVLLLNCKVPKPNWPCSKKNKSLLLTKTIIGGKMKLGG